MRIPFGLGILVVVASATPAARAEPAVPPATQPLTCPDDAESCELDLVGKLVHAKRGEHAKWDDLRVSTVVDRRRRLVHASINIPHRQRLKLQTGARYRFKVAGRKPFGARDLWVVEATRL